jgi:hypothetical protein
MTSVRLVNMIPNSSSGETSQDSEPQVAVNPNNPDEIVATAFTPASGGNGPLYVSTDRGNTWDFRFVVPGGTPRDQSVRFAESGMLYAGTLRGDRTKPNPPRLEILRAANVTLPRRHSGWRPGTVMTSLMTRDSTDQPYVTAMTVGKRDYVFVTNNDSRGAFVDHSDDARSTPPPAGFMPAMIDRRLVTRDSPSVRTAPHEDGTVYAAFCSWAVPPAGTTPTYPTAYIDVVRDDNFGGGTTPFRDLIGGDGKPGVRVAVVQIPFTGNPFTYLGLQRVGSSLSIAVDPRESSSVFIAWGDGPSREATQTLRVRWSGNQGLTWSNDLLVIPNATNPALAITRGGRVALLYQQLVRRRLQTAWETHVQVTQDYWATPAEDILLASTWDFFHAGDGDPYIGDYADLIAVGRELFGVFCADNYPDSAHFPLGVRYQRNADFGKRLLLNVDGVTSVLTSVDPYFFEISWPRL